MARYLTKPPSLPTPLFDYIDPLVGVETERIACFSADAEAVINFMDAGRFFTIFVSFSVLRNQMARGA